MRAVRFKDGRTPTSRPVTFPVRGASSGSSSSSPRLQVRGALVLLFLNCSAVLFLWKKAEKKKKEENSQCNNTPILRHNTNSIRRQRARIELARSFWNGSGAMLGWRQKELGFGEASRPRSYGLKAQLVLVPIALVCPILSPLFALGTLPHASLPQGVSHVTQHNQKC